MKTQAERLRWGVLGVAKINQRLFPAFRKAGRAQPVGLASRSLDRAPGLLQPMPAFPAPSARTRTC